MNLDLRIWLGAVCFFFAIALALRVLWRNDGRLAIVDWLTCFVLVGAGFAILFLT